MILIQVKINTVREGIEKVSDDEYIVWTKKKAIENKANEDVIAQCAKYFNVSKTKIQIVRGKTSKKKYIEVL